LRPAAHRKLGFAISSGHKKRCASGSKPDSSPISGSDVAFTGSPLTKPATVIAVSTSPSTRPATATAATPATGYMRCAGQSVELQLLWRKDHRIASP
jgi:hypothetical protein